MVSPSLGSVAMSTVNPSAFSRSRRADATESSSSMMSILAMFIRAVTGYLAESAGSGSHWQDHPEGCAVSFARVEIEHAVMLVDNLHRDGQPKASAVFLGAEERIKEPFLDLGRDALAGILDLQHDGVGSASADADGVLAGTK